MVRYERNQVKKSRKLKNTHTIEATKALLEMGEADSSGEVHDSDTGPAGERDNECSLSGQ